MLVEPVLIRLGYSKTPATGSTWPKVWWCPNGLLSFLPIHAAGYHNDPQPRSAMDCVISAYTSTVRGLKYSRDNISLSEENRGLIIAMPQTPNQLPLLGSLREAANIRKLTHHKFKLDSVKKCVKGLLARSLPILRAMRNRTNRIHRPVPLIFNDGPITVGVISQLSIRGGSLAYLSACQTALSRAQVTMNRSP